MTPPTDADLDDMHHAIGRPDGPHVKPYRNRYVIGRETEQAARMRETTGWEEAGFMNAGKDSVFMVTPEGAKAVWAWLAAKNKAAGLRLYEVAVRNPYDEEPEWFTSSILAKSRAAAKAAVWRKWDGPTWPEFLRLQPRVRLVPPPEPVTEIPF